MIFRVFIILLTLTLATGSYWFRSAGVYLSCVRSTILVRTVDVFGLATPSIKLADIFQQIDSLLSGHVNRKMFPVLRYVRVRPV